MAGRIRKILSTLLFGACVCIGLAGTVTSMSYFTDLQVASTKIVTSCLEVSMSADIEGGLNSAAERLYQSKRITANIQNHGNTKTSVFMKITAKWKRGLCYPQNAHFYPAHMSDTEIETDLRNGGKSEYSKVVNNGVITVGLPEVELQVDETYTVDVKVIFDGSGIGDVLEMKVAGDVIQCGTYGFTDEFQPISLALSNNYNNNPENNVVIDGVQCDMHTISDTYGSISTQSDPVCDLTAVRVNTGTVKTYVLDTDSEKILTKLGFLLNNGKIYGTAKNSYTVPQKVIIFGFDSTGDKIAEFTLNITIDKAQQTAPIALTATTNTGSKITLTSLSGAEYSMDGITWQDSNVFNGLDMEKVYTFYARYKETANYYASANKTVEGICSYYKWDDTTGGTVDNISKGKIGTVIKGLSTLGQSITEINIPTRCASIGPSAFSNKTSIKNVNFGSNVKTIGSSAFFFCGGITGTLTIPSSVTSIEKGAFQYCKLTNIVLSENLESIEESVFYGSGLSGKVIIPQGVRTIGKSAFSSCKNLTNVVIPTSVTSVGEWSFQATGLTGVLKLPEGIKRIGEAAFRDCSNLTSIVIPKSVTDIGAASFGNCTNVSSISVDPMNAAYKSADGILFNYRGTSLIQYPAGKSGAYPIPKNVTRIENYAFYRCSKLTGTIVFPEAIAYIGDNAFNGCSGLAGTLNLPESITYIGDGAFESTNVSGDITLPSKITSIGRSTFYATKITSIALSNNIISIGDWAFAYCSNLTEVVIPNSVVTIAAATAAFQYCNSLKHIIVYNEEGAISGAPWGAANATVTWAGKNGTKTMSLLNQTQIPIQTNEPTSTPVTEPTPMALPIPTTILPQTPEPTLAPTLASTDAPATAPTTAVTVIPMQPAPLIITPLPSEGPTVTPMQTIIPISTPDGILMPTPEVTPIIGQEEKDITEEQKNIWDDSLQVPINVSRKNIQEANVNEEK